MSSDVSGIGEYIRETGSGQCAIVAALVIALHETGVLSKDRYSDVLNRLWIDMPEEQAVGEAGAAIERVLDLLDAGTRATLAPNDAAPKQPAGISRTVERPVSDDVAA